MKRILLIDDDAGAQLLYRNRLTDLGYEVVVSSTGATGLHEARAAAFDLFLVDIGLGSGIDGYEVCRRLKTIPEIHGVPVVLISGHVKTQEDLHLGYEAGCQSFLVKGDLMLLEDVVRAMLRIKSLQDDLALQNRLLDERNRRLEAEKARTADLEQALASGAGQAAHLRLQPDGKLLVDGEGVVRVSDRGARELFGQVLEDRHLALLAPESRLEAFVRDTRTEPSQSIRFGLPERPGRAARTLLASVHPFVPVPERPETSLRLVFLFDLARTPALQGGASGEFARREHAALVERARESFRPQALLGASPGTRALRERLAQLARAAGPLQLQGPAGSGKGFVARTLHYTGQRSGAFVPVACASLGPQALELELFGAGKEGGGAGCNGAFQEATGGTLFLQDVERLPAPLQLRVLEAVEQGRVRRVGAETSEHVDVRLLVSTRADLGALAVQGAFLPGLARALADKLELTPLSARPEDIAPLAQHFLERHRRAMDVRFTPEALWVLMRHTWPGNVGELEAAVHAACVGSAGRELGVAQLPAALGDVHQRLLEAGERPPAVAAQPGLSALEREIDELVASTDEVVSLLDLYEKAALRHALRLTGNDKLAAARRLGLGKSTFYRKLKEHGIR